jgi:hypothetical protein
MLVFENECYRDFLELKKVIIHLFSEEKMIGGVVPRSGWFFANGIFYASRAGIRSRSKIFYANLLRQLVTGYGENAGDNLLKLHYGVERSWKFILTNSMFSNDVICPGSAMKDFCSDHQSNSSVCQKVFFITSYEFDSLLQREILRTKVT